ncbi:hypothetical protein [Flexibacterium corallicola]|uniref:hypothetical protein n=1 Tax=Flexibacterium corallicola TaxID=3037259 RepID=UPI00286F6B08|nr:hypothetical protein [Pseudovibrio sp. M1P-2-3]
MPLPQFDELPFNSRPDLTPYLLHLTKNTNKDDDYSAFDNLISILKTGVIWGSSRKKGFVKGSRKATCFMDVPFSSLKYVLTPENTDPSKPRYEPYGVAITKKYAYKNGVRPVLYLSDEELEIFNVPRDELWRVVRFQVNNTGWVSWLHEREWRRPDKFILPNTIQAAFVKNTREASNLTQLLLEHSQSFKCKPLSVIPMSVLCQGFLK